MSRLSCRELRAGERVEVLSSDFLDVLASVPDPRDPRGRRYRLAGLLAIAILATAAGMRGYAGFATWAATAPPEVLARLGIRFRRPSEKTFRSVLSRPDPVDLDRRLGAYLTTLAARTPACPCSGKRIEPTSSSYVSHTSAPSTHSSRHGAHSGPDVGQLDAAGSAAICWPCST